MSEKLPISVRSPILRLGTKAIRAVLPDSIIGKDSPGPQQAKAIGTGSGVTFVGSPDFTNVIRLDGGANPDADRLTRNIAVATSAYAYTAIMYRAQKLAEPPLSVVEDTDDGEMIVSDHELSLLLDEPSMDYDMGELIALTEIYRLVSGACLWRIEEDLAGRTARLVPFSGDEFKTFRQDGRIYGRFQLTGKETRDLTPEEVVFFRELNPNSWRRHLPPLEVALSLLDLGHQVNRTVRNFMRKALIPGGVISPDKDWHPSDDEWERFKNTIEAWHSGPANAGEALVVEGGTEFSQTAIPLKELLPEKILNRIEAVTGSVFGIPPVVLGWQVGLENSPWSQMGEARQMTYEDTIEPRWRDYERKIQRRLLPEEERLSGRKIRFNTSEVRAFQQDDLERAQVVSILRDDWTRNERRVYTGQDPLPEDDPRGDEIGVSSPLGGLGGPLGDGGGEGGEEEDSAVARLLARKGKLSVEDKTWLVFETGTKAAERTWRNGIGKALERIQSKAIDLLDDTLREEKTVEEGIEIKQVDPDSVVEFLLVFRELLGKEGEEILREAALPLVTSTGTTAVRRVASSVGLSFATLEPNLLEYAAEEADFLASVMGESTGRMVAGVVQRQVESGGVIRDIRKELQEAHAFSRERAQLVARTETTRAWNGAQRRSLSKWQEEQPEDVKTVKVWLSSRDARVRPEHDALDDGKRYRIDELFPNGLQEPGEPNCRCTLLYEIQRGEEGD